jgi:hypothetical protein
MVFIEKLGQSLHFFFLLTLQDDIVNEKKAKTSKKTKDFFFIPQIY